MFIALAYTLVGGIILYLIEININKKTKVKLLQFQIVTGWINTILAIFFIFLYYMYPSIFSKDTQITSQLILFCFTVLAIYYYLLAAPLVLANVLILLKVKSKEKLLLYLNTVAYLLLVASYLLFL